MNYLNPENSRHDTKYGRLSQMIENHGNYSSINLQLHSNPNLQINPLRQNSQLIKCNLPTSQHTQTQPKQSHSSIKIKRKPSNKLAVPVIKINQNNNPSSNLNSSRMIQSVIVQNSRQLLVSTQKNTPENRTSKKEMSNKKNNIVIKQIWKKKSCIMSMSVRENKQNAQTIIKPKDKDIHHLFTIKRNNNEDKTIQRSNNNKNNNNIKTSSNQLKVINNTISKLQQTLLNKYKSNSNTNRQQYNIINNAPQPQHIQQQHSQQSMFKFDLFDNRESEKYMENNSHSKSNSHSNRNVSLSLSFGFNNKQGYYCEEGIIGEEEDGRVNII